MLQNNLSEVSKKIYKEIIGRNLSELSEDDIEDFNLLNDFDKPYYVVNRNIFNEMSGTFVNVSDLKNVIISEGSNDRYIGFHPTFMKVYCCEILKEVKLKIKNIEIEMEIEIK